MSTIICSECGESIDECERLCPKCGFPIPKRRISCPECGRKIDEKSQICPECGAPLTCFAQVSSATQSVNASSESGTVAILAMLFAFIFPPVGFILGIIGLKYYQTKIHRRLCIASILLSIVIGIIIFNIINQLIPVIQQGKEMIDTFSFIDSIFRF